MSMDQLGVFKAKRTDLPYQTFVPKLRKVLLINFKVEETVLKKL